MKKRQLGASDLWVSEVGLGCNNFGMKIDSSETTAVVHSCLDGGIEFFDTADMYGGGKSEEFLGAALGARRRDIVLATKFGGIEFSKGKTGFGAPESITASVDASLRRLRTDYIDLYQMHYPDSETPIEETLGALDQLVRAGKIRVAGSSNFDAAQIEAASNADSQQPLATAQNEWNLLNRAVESEIVPACEAAGVSMIPFFPLASGMLTGKYERGEEFADGSRLATLGFFANIATEENFSKVEAVSSVARDSGRTLLELAFSWLAAQPCVASVIAGATSSEQVTANARATARALSAEESESIETALSALESD